MGLDDLPTWAVWLLWGTALVGAWTGADRHDGFITLLALFWMIQAARQLFRHLDIWAAADHPDRDEQ